tara:strand:+ start:1335 stop:1571 length:237 start_codon:yes stop_codon:yes gene_type:complete
MDLPHGLKGKAKAPVPTQDALQFKVEEVIEKKEKLKEKDIFETIEQFDSRVDKSQKEAVERAKAKKGGKKRKKRHKND